MPSGSAQRIAQSLLSARQAWELTPKQLAFRTGLPESQIRTAERTGRVESRVLAAIAAALGGTFDDLLAGHEFWSAPAYALRSTREVDPAVLRHGLTRASAAARDYRALVRLLGLPDLWAERGSGLGPRGIEAPVTQQAEELATLVRASLGNATEPFTSVRMAMARLGVAAFYAEFASEDVDGAMWRWRKHPPCVVVNARARGGLVTAHRMTFAHELCHALFDRPKEAETGHVDARGTVHADQEQRANAFAAYFLAPRKGVLQFLREVGVPGAKRPSTQSLLALSMHFGIGVEAMAHHLVNLGLWSDEDVEKNRGLRSQDLAHMDNRELHPTLAEAEVPLERRGVLLELATQALSARTITTGRWRELLELSATGEWRTLLAERHIEFHNELHLGA